MNSQRRALQNLRRLPQLADARWLESEDAEAACDVFESGLHRSLQPRKFRLHEPTSDSVTLAGRARRH
ncbi:MAG: hypothetical protein ACREUW_15130 [Burkholderiales bacterium]